MFGLSNTSLRFVPLVLELVAVACMFLLARRVVSPALAVLACALLALHPTAIEYSHTLKPYSGELAATTVVLLATVVYLQKQTRRSFFGLIAALIVVLPLAYPVIFLLPGIALTVRRPTLLAPIGVFVVLYFVFIRPNFTPALREFFKSSADSGFSPGLLLALLFCIVAAITGWRKPMQLVCALPCILLAVSGMFGWYPESHRTRLFVLPCFILLVAMTAEDLLHRKWGLSSQFPILCITLVLPFFAIWKQVTEHRNQPEEDVAGAVRFLQQNVRPDDVVLVHPSVREGFLLYAAIDGWKAPPAIFGDTGWPCCQRGRDPKPGGSTEKDIVEDLDARIPRDFRGRIWLYATTRPTQWTYVGMKEQDVWKRYFWDRGCTAGSYFKFENQGISPMDCTGLRPRQYNLGER